MRKITAHYIYRGEGEPVKYGIVTLADGVVVSISEPASSLREAEATEFYPGVIMPAIVGVTTSNDDTVWTPTSNQEVLDVINSQQTLPIFAVITPENIAQLAADALESILSKEIMLVLGGKTHQVHLFRLLQSLSQKLPALSFTQLVAIACTNGAAAMQLRDKGRIAPHLRPGICHVSRFDFKRQNISENSQINILTC